MSSTSKPDGTGWEVVGPPECPILYRRELLATRPLKAMVHRFVANARDHDCHDHPRPFVTLILRGGYDDVQPDGEVERLRAPAIRYRAAEHAHITQVHADGALTFVVMGPVRRKWGFWRDGRWWPVALYERVFGLAFRCEPPVTTDAPPAEEVQR